MKVCAVALLPAAVGSIVSHRVGDINGDILGVFTAVALYAALTKLILRQTWQDTGVIVFALWTMHAAVMWFNYKLQSAKSGAPF